MGLKGVPILRGEHPTFFAMSTISGSIENDKKLSHFCHGVCLVAVEICLVQMYLC